MDFRKAYFSLYAAMADAIDAMEQQNYGIAKDILIKTQQKWEESYMEQEDRPYSSTGKPLVSAAAIATP